MTDAHPGTSDTAEIDLIVHHAKLAPTRQDGPQLTALAVSGEHVVAVGGDEEVLRGRQRTTRVIDAGGRRLIPGLNDSHLHAIRGGLFYTLELRWDGVRTLKRALEMIAEQAKRTPDGQWVRVIGGWSPFQFAERRMPTIAELNEAAPNTPVFILFAYSRVLLNHAGAEAIGQAPENGGYIADGTPAAYALLAKLPAHTSKEERLVSTRYFWRELNRFGLTSVVDAGASGVAYPDDYSAVATLAGRPGLGVRVSHFLFAQSPGTEKASWEHWAAEEQRAVNQAWDRLNGFVLRGAGEILVWSASDFEDFRAPRPELPESALAELEEVTRVIAASQWPIRVHATYDETITRILDVFERVFAETGYTARWAIDHAETIGASNIARMKALGGGIAVQDRLAFAGEYFLEHQGPQAAEHVQPLRQIVEAGIPLGGGTDATRVAGYNPWISLYWLVTGKTVGGAQIAAPAGRLSRWEALRIYTAGSAWFSGEENVKGLLAPGQLADFALLTDDYLDPRAVPDEQIPAIESVLTVTGGEVVYAAAPFQRWAPEPLPPVSPSWSPVAEYGGYQQGDGPHLTGEAA
ncbi:amidohydrolase [Catenulispora sp. NL8]|uniref:Amidohydrolase n=1 Tax=Catenulispora pinistramenti TaxID=2705254 RepID=A0ABS5KQI6_9ACTN|nr:amidohydrolase [Catenulispora pinistramenti]MBS2548303.1 amidohydrolase [Catenulispora pinistramenti]